MHIAIAVLFLLENSMNSQAGAWERENNKKKKGKR